MRNVLVVANLAHASPRMQSIAKYLRSSGWEAIIVTPPIEGALGRMGASSADLGQFCKVVETSGYGSRIDVVDGLVTAARRRADPTNVLWRIAKMLYRVVNSVYRVIHRYYREIRWYPDEDKRWLPLAIDAGEQVLATKTVNAIVTSSSPVSVHLAGKHLSALSGVPWVADLRDLWTQNHNYSASWVRRLIERRLERRTLRHAGALVTISDEWVEKLHDFHKTVPVFSVKNGFDPQLYSLHRDARITREFTITYTGQIYGNAQDPTILLEAVRQLVEEELVRRKDVRVRFFGTKNPSVVKYVQRHSMDDIVQLLGVVPLEQSVRAQCESQVLFLLNWQDDRGAGWYPLKLFEYLGAERPIVALGGTGADVVVKLLSRTNAGVYCRNVQDTRAALIRHYHEYTLSGSARYSGDPSSIEEFSFETVAKKYAELLNRVVGVTGETNAPS